MAAVPPAAAQDPVNRTAQAYYMRGSFMESGGDLVLAYTYYTYAEKYEPDNARIELALARVTLEMGKLDDARKYAMKLIDKDIYADDARLVRWVASVSSCLSGGGSLSERGEE